uniref:Uncharacterized protein n=1 Tax=Acrobeloides nanus TaxID=290746 RepID=A0A914DAM6_9BILA
SLGIEKDSASKIKRALTTLQSWCQKHPTAEDSEADDTDNESKIDPSELFWEALKSAPGRVILKRPAFIDLSMAVISEHQRRVDYLLRLHPDRESQRNFVNKKGKKGWTPLMCACVIAKEITKVQHVNGKLLKEREYPIIKKILLAGANITAQNDKGQTALMLAASYGHYEV